MVRARVRVSVPGDVQLFAGLRLHLFEAGDELAVGRLRVVREAARQGSDGLEEELLLLVPDSREVRDLRRREVLDSDVDVLARAGRGLGSGMAQGAHHLLQGIEVFPVQDGRQDRRQCPLRVCGLREKALCGCGKGSRSPANLQPLPRNPVAEADCL